MKSRIARTAALAVAAFAVLFLVALTIKDMLPASETAVSADPSVRHQLRAENTGEFIQEIKLGPDGKPESAKITYVNGDHGWRSYRPDGTKKEEQLLFKNGGIRRRAVFADDDKTIIEGKEVRPDGTTLWAVSKNEEDAIITEYFYHDGKAKFSRTEYQLGQPAKKIEYFRRDGTLMAEWITDIKEERIGGMVLYARDGKTVRLIRQEMQDGSVLINHMQAGKLDYQQVFARKSQWVTDDKGGSRWQYSYFLSGVAVMNADGETPARVIRVLDGNVVKTVVDWNKDGTRRLRHLRPDGTVEAEVTLEHDGVAIDDREYRAQDNVRVPIADKYLFEQPTMPDFKGFWNEQETTPEKRSQNEPPAPPAPTLPKPPTAPTTTGAALPGQTQTWYR